MVLFRKKVHSVGRVSEPQKNKKKWKTERESGVLYTLEDLKLVPNEWDHAFEVVRKLNNKRGSLRLVKSMNESEEEPPDVGMAI